MLLPRFSLRFVLTATALIALGALAATPAFRDSYLSRGVLAGAGALAVTMFAYAITFLPFYIMAKARPDRPVVVAVVNPPPEKPA